MSPYKISDLFPPIGKKVLYVQTFEPSISHDQGGRYPVAFSAYHAAEAWLKELGYLTGIMNAKNPIGFAPALGTDYISKWHNLTGWDMKKLHGVMLSQDFREDKVYVVFCESPLKSLIESIPFNKIK